MRCDGLETVMKREEVSIQTEYIRMDNLLKKYATVETGGQAKLVIQAGQVFLNGAVCTQRGKKLRGGDQVIFENILYEVRRED